MVSDIYFGTIDGGLITNFELANMAKVVGGNEIDYNDLESVREYAKTCKGIKGEVKHPSIRFLLEHGQKVKAVQIYHRKHPELGLKESKEIIDKMAERIKNGSR